MIREELVSKLEARTGVDATALQHLSGDTLSEQFARTVNPARVVAQLMAASPLLMAALYTLGTGRIVTGGIMAAAGGYLAFSAREGHEKNQAASRDITRQLAAKLG